MSRNICLLGATNKDIFFVKNSQLLLNNGYKITLIVSNHSFENTCDCSVLGFDEIDVEEIVSYNDIFIFLDSPQCSDDFVFTLLKKLLLYKKEIYNYHMLGLEYEIKLSKFANEKKSAYYYYGKKNISLCNQSVSKIQIPIIYIMSLLENMEKMNLELAIYGLLNNRGYKTGVVCSNTKGEFFGTASFPFSIFERTQNMNEIADELFHYINKYVMQNDLDVLIIGIPSGVFLPFDDSRINYPLYLLKKICPPDYIILNVLNNTFNNNSIETINDLVLDEINQSVDALYITSIIDDVVNYEYEKPSRSFSIDFNYNAYIPSSHKLIVEEFNENKYELIVDDIENKLSQ